MNYPVIQIRGWPRHRSAPYLIVVHLERVFGPLWQDIPGNGKFPKTSGITGKFIGMKEYHNIFPEYKRENRLHRHQLYQRQRGSSTLIRGGI